MMWQPQEQQRYVPFKNSFQTFVFFQMPFFAGISLLLTGRGREDGAGDGALCSLQR